MINMTINDKLQPWDNEGWREVNDCNCFVRDYYGPPWAVIESWLMLCMHALCRCTCWCLRCFWLLGIMHHICWYDMHEITDKGMQWVIGCLPMDIRHWGKYVRHGLVFFGKGPDKVKLFDCRYYGNIPQKWDDMHGFILMNTWFMHE